MVLPNDAVARVQTVLKAALSHNRAEQKLAENTIRREIDLNPDTMIAIIAKLLQTQGVDSEVRSLSAVLLRRNLPLGEPMLLTKLNDQLQCDLKQGLLQALTVEPSSALRSMLADTIAELAQITLYREAWPDLLPFLQNLAISEPEHLREAALDVLGKIGDALPDVHAASLDSLVELFARGLQDSSLRCRIAALKSVSITFANADDQQSRLFNKLCPLALTLVSSVVGAQQATDVMSMLVSMATRQASFFTDEIEVLNKMIYSILEVDDHDLRQMTLEFFTTISEGSGNIMRKSPSLLQASVAIAFKVMLAMDDYDDTWASKTLRFDMSEDMYFGAGEAAIDRLARAVGGDIIVPTVFPIIDHALRHTDWRSRFTALIALTQIGEVLPASQLQELVPLVLRYVDDDNARVQYAAINCIGQLCTDFGPSIQADYHALILPSLLSAMAIHRHDRVQSHAAAAVINFAEPCVPETMQIYADTLVHALYEMLQRPAKIVQEQAITAVASIAQCLGESFVTYYDAFVPLLKFILQSASTKDNQMLCGRALECVTFIGMAVGATKFQNDAREVMQASLAAFVVNTNSSSSSSLSVSHSQNNNKCVTEHEQNELFNNVDDSSFAYLLQAWNGISVALGAGFVEFLPMVMPVVIRAAKTECILDRIDEYEQNDGHDGFFDINEERFGLHSHLLERKTLGCSVLSSLARTMKSHFIAFVPQTTQTLLPLLTFTFDDSIRQHAAHALPCLLSSTVMAAKNGQCDAVCVNELSSVMLAKLVTACQEERDVHVLVVILQALKSCISMSADCATSTITPTFQQDMKTMLLQLLMRSEKRITTRRRHIEETEFDEEDLNFLSTENMFEDEIVYLITEVFGAMLRIQREHCLSVYTEVMANFPQMLTDSSPLICRKFALFLVRDFVEIMGESAITNLISTLAPLILHGAAHSESIELRVLYVSNIAVFAQFAIESFAPYVNASCRIIRSIITQQAVQVNASSTDELARLYDTAVTALGKLLRYHRQALGHQADDAANHWLQCLPLHAVAHESIACTNLLVDLVEGNDEVILGIHYAHLPRIIEVFLKALGTQLSSESTNLRIIGIIKQLPLQLFVDVIAKLPSEAYRAKAQNVRSQVA